jgi:hypothetical protein
MKHHHHHTEKTFKDLVPFFFHAVINLAATKQCRPPRAIFLHFPLQIQRIIILENKGNSGNLMEVA